MAGVTRAAGAALAVCLLLAADGPEILRPTHESVVPPGEITVVARTKQGKLTLDGKPLVLAEAGPGAFSAEVEAAPGRHELVLEDTAGTRTVSFFAGDAKDAPEGWRRFRSHPPVAACGACHKVEEGAWTFAGDASCFGCHEKETFPEAHTHNPVVLAECQMCHLPHGSTAPAHLKLRRDLACKQCHG
jgi:predicted CXXCH cytochrome family protein